MFPNSTWLVVVAEWSKALDLGSSLHWRGFKSHRQHILQFSHHVYMFNIRTPVATGMNHTSIIYNHLLWLISVYLYC